MSCSVVLTVIRGTIHEVVAFSITVLTVRIVSKIIADRAEQCIQVCCIVKTEGGAADLKIAYDGWCSTRSRDVTISHPVTRAKCKEVKRALLVELTFDARLYVKRRKSHVHIICNACLTYLLERPMKKRRSDSDSGQSRAEARVVAQPAAMCRHHHVIARLIHHAETSTLNLVFAPDCITIAFY